MKDVDVESLRSKIQDFKLKNFSPKKIRFFNYNNYIGYFFVDMLASVIFSFFVYHLYVNFFGQSRLFFALLLFFSTISSLYSFIKKLVFRNEQNRSNKTI